MLLSLYNAEPSDVCCCLDGVVLSFSEFESRPESCEFAEFLQLSESNRFVVICLSLIIVRLVADFEFLQS